MSVTLTPGDIFTPIVDTAENIASWSIVNGQALVAIDTKEFFVDDNNSRIKLSDVITGTYSSITGNLSPLTDKIFFATDTHQLLQATRDGSNNVVWHQLGGGSQSEVVTISSSEAILELQDNKIYYLTNASNASIQLTAASSLSYCTICFTAGAGTTWTVPNNARCIGYDCTGGFFTPVPGREYQIAVDKLNNLLTFYVLVASLNKGSVPTDSALSTTSTNPVANNVITAAINTKADVSSKVTNTDTSVSLTLANNTIYRCTNASITGLTISGVATGFEYATVIFTSPSTAATFAMPETGYYCKGAACEDGEFTPEASMRYNLAIENEGDRIAIYVMEAL